MSVALFAGSLSAIAEDLSDPTERPATVVMLTAPDQSLELPAPASQFAPAEGEKLWNEARGRAGLALPEQGTGFFSVADRLPDGFRVARWFEAEEFTNDPNSCELQMAISAEHAERLDNVSGGKVQSHLLLQGMRLTYFISKGNNTAPPGNKAGAEKKSASGSKSKSDKSKSESNDKEKSPPSTSAPSTAAALEGMLPNGGRVIIKAPNADIDVITNEGRATGGVTIEVFPNPEPGKEPFRIALLQSERLNWRTWSEPSIGSQELAAYTSGAQDDSSKPEPVVSGTFNILQPDGSMATTRVEGQGLVYEIGVVDHLEHVYDEEGREAGLSRTAHNRALFHKQIKMVTTASSMSGVLPFQPAAGADQTKTKKAPEPQNSEPPSKTVIVCEGPAIFDLASLPRSKPTNAKLQKTPLAHRYDFLNRVTMTKIPLDPKTLEELKDGNPTEMSCMHLCLQYPPGIVPGPGTFPDYSEAIGGVKMKGFSSPQPVEGQPPPVPMPMLLLCERLYLDGASDNMYLVGTPQAPAHIINQTREAVAQQFSIHTKTQTMMMPVSGPKKLILKPDPNAKPPTPPSGEAPKSSLNLSTNETIITWNGTLSRELKHLPVPNQADIDKEVLLFKDNVQIEIPATGTQFRGDTVKIVRSYPEGDLEFLEGDGNAYAMMNQTQASGETITMELAHDEKGTPTRDVITVIGSRKLEAKATLIGNGSSIRADKFIVDNLARTLESFGGAVSMVRMSPPTATPAPAAPKTEGSTPTPGADASVGNALFKGMSFDMSQPIWIQCDGEFTKSADGTITTRKNVLIHQPGKQLICDEAFFYFEPPTQPAPAGDNSLISGELSKIVCNGSVELTSNEQLLQCDHLVNNVKGNSALMTMDDPENDVRIYKINSTGTQVISVLRSLTYDTATGMLTPSTDIIKQPGQKEPSPNVLILPYRDKAPAPRDKASGPRQRKSGKS